MDAKDALQKPLKPASTAKVKSEVQTWRSGRALLACSQGGDLFIPARLGVSAEVKVERRLKPELQRGEACCPKNPQPLQGFFVSASG